MKGRESGQTTGAPKGTRSEVGRGEKEDKGSTTHQPKKRMNIGICRSTRLTA